MQPSSQPTAIDPDVEVFEKIVASLTTHIFGDGEQGIKDKLKQAEDLPKEIGSLAFTMVEQAFIQAKEAGVDTDIDIMLGVATEVIDSLLQLSEALGLIESADDETMREDALMNAINAYLLLSDPTPEEREAAQQMLSQMADAGEVAEAEGVIRKMGEKRGTDPFSDVDDAGPAVQPTNTQASMKPALMQE